MRWLFAALLSLVPYAAAAQAPCPVPPQHTPEFSAGGNVFGRLASQWNAYFASKVDTVGGTLCNPVIIGAKIVFRNLTPGAVLFGAADGTITQDATLNWVAASRRLGVGTTSPVSAVDAIGDVTARSLDATTSPGLLVRQTGGVGWAFRAAATTGDLRGLIDTGQEWLHVTRSGTTVTDVKFPNGTVTTALASCSDATHSVGADASGHLVCNAAIGTGLMNAAASNATLPAALTNLGLGTASVPHFKGLLLDGNGPDLTLGGDFPAIYWTGQFGGWQTAIDIAAATNPADFVIADKCDLPDCSTGVRDQLYSNHNQSGIWAAPTVTAQGINYVNDDKVQLDTRVGTITGSVAGGVLTVTNHGSVTLAAGQAIYLTSALPLLTTAPTIIQKQLTDTSGTPWQNGTYKLSTSTLSTGSASITVDRCVVPPWLLVTNAVAGAIQTGGVAVYTVGGQGRCTSAPANPVGQASTTGSGSGATFTAAFLPNPPTLAVGRGQLAAITFGYVPYMLTVQAWSDRAAMGGLNVQVTAGNSGPAFAVSNGNIDLVRIAQDGTLALLPSANLTPLTVSGYSLTGAASAPMVSRSGTLNTTGLVNVLDTTIIDTAHGVGSLIERVRGGVAGTTVLRSLDTVGNQILGGSLNRVTITPPATGATLTIADAKTLTDTSGAGANLLLGAAGGGFAAYGGASCTNQFPRSLSAAGAATCASVAIGSDVSGLAANVTAFLSTPSSANLLAAVTDKTGSGALVFAASPTLTGTVTVNTGANTNLLAGPWGANAAYNSIGLNGSLTATGGVTISSGATADPVMYFGIPSGGNYTYRVANVLSALMTSVNFAHSGSMMIGSTTALTLGTGALGMKTAAAASAPGAAGGSVQLECVGDASGKGKIVVYFGTSSTGTVIGTAIGAGGTGC